MSFDPQELLLYALLVAGTALIAHSFTRDFMRSSAFVAIGCSLINVGHEIVRHDFHIRPSDAAFWLPALYLWGLGAAFPVAVVVSLPFHAFWRRKSKRTV